MSSMSSGSVLGRLTNSMPASLKARWVSSSRLIRERAVRELSRSDGTP
jgi:hypothetical protein